MYILCIQIFTLQELYEFLTFTSSYVETNIDVNNYLIHTLHVNTAGMVEFL